MPTRTIPFIGLIALTLALALGGSTVQAQPVTSRPAPTISTSSYPARNAGSASPIGNWFPISPINNDISHLAESHPAVTYNSQYQQYLTVWDQNTRDGESYVFGQLVNRFGGLVASSFLVPGFTGSSIGPDAAYNPGRNEYLIVYAYDQPSFHAVYGQRLGANESAVGAPITFASSTTYTFSDPTVAFETDTGKYLVAWQKRQGITSSGIEARALSGDGTTLSSPIEITGMLAILLPERPDVACTRTLDECLVVWDRWFDTSLTDYEVHGQRIHMAGGAHLEGSTFPILYSLNDEVYPSVAAIAKPTGIGQYLVVSAQRSSGEWSSVGRLLTDAGFSEGSLSLGSSNGIPPAVAGNENAQEYLVAWPTMAGTGIQARTVSTTGAMGTLVQATPPSHAPMYPAIADGPYGDFVVTFQDNYTGYPVDIFGWLWGTRLHLPMLRRGL